MELNRIYKRGDKLVMKTDNPLAESITDQFTSYEEKHTPEGSFYQFDIMPNMCFSVRAMLARYDVFTAEIDALRAIRDSTELSTMPVLDLYKSGRHVQITCPPLSDYLNIVDAVGAAAQGMNTYTVPIARAFDVVRAVKAHDSYLPDFYITRALKEVLIEPLDGFNGTISSLFEIPITELHAAAKAYRVNHENWENFGYHSVADALITQPQRYIDKTQISDFFELEKGTPVTYIGEIVDKRIINFKHSQFDIKVANTTFSVIYYYRQWMHDKFNIGDEVLLMGEYNGRNNINGQSLESLIEAKSLDIVPIYSQSPKNNITSKIILNVVYEAIERIKPHVDELDFYIDKEEIPMSLGEAIVEMHFPSSSYSYLEALETLALYEMTYLQLLILDRKANEVKSKGLEMPYKSGGYFDAMVNSLPWDLTDAQKQGLNKMNKYMSTDTAEQVLLTADVGSGKGLLEDELIATPKGWVKMKDIKVGQEILGSDGKSTRVIGVYPQGEQELAKLTFSDGTEIITDMSHLWTLERSGVYDNRYPSGKRPSFTISTRQLLSKDKSPMRVPYFRKDGSLSHYQNFNMETHYLKNDGTARWRVPLMSGPARFNQEDDNFILDPYLFGYWLGDGSHRVLNFAIGGDDLDEFVDNAKALWDGEIKVIKDPRGNVYDVQLRNENIVMTELLRDIGVFKNKHIPKQYMMSSPESREKLLQGLIDSDGSIGKGGDVTFGNTNEVLIENVIELVQSLGGMAWKNGPYFKKYINNHGEKVRTDKASWSVTIQLPSEITPSRLSRKANRYVSRKPKRSHKLSRTLVKVEKLDYKAKTICIKVDAEDELFITKDYLVTHNTVVAQLACMQALDNGRQAVLAGPTEVLAIQLYDTFKKVAESMPAEFQPNIAFLGGKMKAKERRELLKYIENGAIDIVVGTHSVLNRNIKYNDLGLVVIDEQQKFGAAQREALLDSREDGRKPDLLAQTATPIPRSTAQAFYGDIDMIQLDGKPEGRIEIETEWIKTDPKKVTKDSNHKMWEDIRKEVEKGHQVFVVVPMVFESKKMDSASVEGAYKDLKKTLKGVRVGYTHGSLKKADQHEAMEKFRNNELDVLIASTVIEVGVDVPNATRIVILSADRLGASSLHQVRGRVGRSNLPSKCYLVSEGKTAASKARLQALVDSTDGFDIAQVDLKTRGEGDLFGLRQAGESSLRFASLVDHSKLVGLAQRLSKEIYDSRYRDVALKDAQAIILEEEE